jgi:putative restriction modification system DNA specificity subunit
MEYKEYKLEELVKIKYGRDQKRVASPNGTIPIYGTGGFMGYATKALYTKPSVLIGRKGTIDKIRFMQNPFWTVDTLFYTEINENIILPKYFYYLLCLEDLSRYNEGTTIPSLRTETLNRIPLKIPSLEIQGKVLSVLNPIDDIIVYNTAINKNLEKQAQTIFNAWFVDLLPFNRKIPSDWKILKFADIAELSAGGDKPAIVSETKSKECPYPIYSNGIAFNGLYGYTNIPRVKAESVTISARGTIGFVCLRNIPYVPIVRLITAIPKEHLVSAKYLYFWLKHIPIAGTGTTQQQLTIPAFKNTEILVPPIDIIIEFTDKVSHLFNLRYLYETEIETLTSLRDTLLPRLMSGELDVSNIEL